MKKTVTTKVRGCDKFGAPVSLGYEGSSEYKTLGGGIVTLSL